jgi:protein TonB
VPKEAAAPKSRIVIAERPAPAVAGKGSDDSSGARDRGTGTGAGGAGNGTGSGNGGNGTGGGAVTKAVKTAGDINSTRDYPSDSRDARLGHEVIVYLTVGTDGRARNCRVQKASPDPRADAITCTLAEQRFRFRPATDAAGNPVESVYGWRQRWFRPGEKN